MMKVVLMQMCTIDTKGQEHTTHAYQCHYFSAAEYPHVHAACLIAASEGTIDCLTPATDQSLTQKLTLPDVPDLAVDLVEHACKLLVLRLWHDWQTIDHCMQEADGVGQQQQQSGDLLLL